MIYLNRFVNLAIFGLMEQWNSAKTVFSSVFSSVVINADNETGKRISKRETLIIKSNPPYTYIYQPERVSPVGLTMNLSAEGFKNLTTSRILLIWFQWNPTTIELIFFLYGSVDLELILRCLSRSRHVLQCFPSKEVLTGWHLRSLSLSLSCSHITRNFFGQFSLIHLSFTAVDTANSCLYHIAGCDEYERLQPSSRYLELRVHNSWNDVGKTTLEPIWRGALLCF